MHGPGGKSPLVTGARSLVTAARTLPLRPLPPESRGNLARMETPRRLIHRAIATIATIHTDTLACTAFCSVSVATRFDEIIPPQKKKEKKKKKKTR